jgi:glutathione S-transferase
LADLELIGVPFSNYVRSLRMLCEEKGVAYTLTPARPQSSEVTAIHPAGQIPCLRHGDLALFESQAIATYIDKAFPGPKLIPEDAKGAAQVVQWSSYGNVKVDRWVMREFVVPYAFADKVKGPDMTKINTAVPEIEKCLAALDKAVATTGQLVGTGLTYADLNVLPMLATLTLYGQGKDMLGKHAALSNFVTKLTARPSYAKTAPAPRG